MVYRSKINQFRSYCQLDGIGKTFKPCGTRPKSGRRARF